MAEEHITGEEYFNELYNDLRSQLCCAWEEWAEQHADQDESSPAAMKATELVKFRDSEIVVIGKDRSIHHYRFNLERIG